MKKNDYNFVKILKTETEKHNNKERWLWCLITMISVGVNYLHSWVQSICYCIKACSVTNQGCSVVKIPFI